MLFFILAFLGFSAPVYAQQIASSVPIVTAPENVTELENITEKPVESTPDKPASPSIPMMPPAGLSESKPTPSAPKPEEPQEKAPVSEEVLKDKIPPSDNQDWERLNETTLQKKEQEEAERQRRIREGLPPTEPQATNYTTPVTSDIATEENGVPEIVLPEETSESVTEEVIPTPPAEQSKIQEKPQPPVEKKELLPSYIAPKPDRKPAPPEEEIFHDAVLEAPPVSFEPTPDMITQEEAVNIALTEAPPARSMRVQRLVYETVPVYVVQFKTEKGIHEVMVDALSGVIVPPVN